VRGPLVVSSLATALSFGSFACAPIISTSVPSSPPRSVLVVPAKETADCMRSSTTVRMVDEELRPTASAELDVSDVLDSVPPDVARTIRAAQLEPTLARLMAQQKLGSDAKLDVTALRLQVLTRISSLEIQLSSLAFEVGCMGRQMDAVLLELDRLQQRQQLVLTIASLVVGAATGIGAGVWEIADEDSMPGPLVLGVVGGTASLGLGIAGFVPRRGHVVYAHDRNPLTPIVRGEDPDGIYPPFVFRMLGDARAGEPSSRDELIEDWRRIIDETVPERDRERAEAVLYGKGGMYDRNLVDAREKMLDRLESELDGIDRDLEVLYRFLGVVLEDRALQPAADP
jgi:hypothetical protein